MKSAVLPLLLASSLAFAQSVKEEHSEVAQQLSAEKAALEGLKTQKVSLAEFVALVERRTRAQKKRMERLELEQKAVDRQIALAERREAWARAILDQKVKALGPRLYVLYRLKRRNPLDVLLSAQDFASLMRTSRGMQQVMARDLELLNQVRDAEAYQKDALQNLDRMKISLEDRVEDLADARQAEEEQRLEMNDLLAEVQAQARQSSRNVKDLEMAEKQLAELVHELDHPPENGFGALKGKLALPTNGVIEVGFGKIVNPKFNTVILQKGIDLRAANDTPIFAVAKGRVVHEGWVRGYGNVMIVEHPGTFHTVMAHLGKFSKQVGDEVEEGDELGRVGETASLKGPYLYFEIRQKGIALDPTPWFKAR